MLPYLDIRLAQHVATDFKVTASKARLCNLTGLAKQGFTRSEYFALSSNFKVKML